MKLFVAFEGGEGSGKSTQAETLCRRLSRHGFESLLVSEPGGTAVGFQIRDILKKQWSPPLSPESELFLFQASRAQLTSEVIAPALAEDKAVVCDRFSYSTIAYQGYGRGMDTDMLEYVSSVATHKLEADLVVLLDVPPAEALARKERREDSFELESLEFHQRVRQGYLNLAYADAGRWLILDGMQRRDELAARVWERVTPLLHKNGNPSARPHHSA